MSLASPASKLSDVIVVGLGGVGSAACYWLAKHGYSVVGVDQFDPPHRMGEGIPDGQHFPDDQDRKLVEAFLQSYLPEVELQLKRWSGCYYTMTPDEHFIVDRLPDQANVVVVAGLSGHGFKFTSVLGQIAGELAIESHSVLDIDFLRFHRFGESGSIGSGNHVC